MTTYAMQSSKDSIHQIRQVKCADCGKDVPEDSVVCCDMCGAPLCEECGTTGRCFRCAELMELEIDLKDMEAEEES